MKEFKGTKGAWIIGNHSSTVVSDERVRNSNFPMPLNPEYSTDEFKDEYGGYLICESIGNRDDAQLIAAAPEMLKALIDAKKQMLRIGITVDNADIYNSINNIINNVLSE